MDNAILRAEKFTAADERQHQRATSVFFFGKLETETGISICRIFNLSSIGACIQTRQSLQTGQQVRFEINSAIQLKAKVFLTKSGRTEIKFAKKVNIFEILFCRKFHRNNHIVRKPRYDLIAISRIKSNNEITECKTVNVSQNGACLQNTVNGSAIRVGQDIHIEINGLSKKRAKVVWKNGSKMGVEFYTGIRNEEFDFFVSYC